MGKIDDKVGCVLNFLNLVGSALTLVIFISVVVLVGTSIANVYWPGGYVLRMFAFVLIALLFLPQLIVSIVVFRSLRTRLAVFVLAVSSLFLSESVLDISDACYFRRHTEEFGEIALVTRAVGTVQSLRQEDLPLNLHDGSFHRNPSGADTVSVEHYSRVLDEILKVLDSVSGGSRNPQIIEQQIQTLRMNTCEVGEDYVLFGYHRGFFVGYEERGFMYSPAHKLHNVELPWNLHVGNEIEEGWYHYDRYWD